MPFIVPHDQKCSEIWHKTNTRALEGIPIQMLSRGEGKQGKGEAMGAKGEDIKGESMESIWNENQWKLLVVQHGGVQLGITSSPKTRRASASG